uniref:Small ribosomal subunit protein bS6c n=1 Tax=Toxarium undulatum TaxID=210620 RepID=A0A1D8D9N2_9STRA|nr:ribosomal protein S6 [Toxarium undulatum]AOS86642.1 ribosomal protein S6 [Toxarium undulatum]
MKYEMMVVLTEEYNNTELKIWAFNFGKILKKLNASDISVISRGKRDLNYLIKNRNRGNFIQVNFVILPDYIKQLSKDLNLDSNVLRFLIFNIDR